MKSTISTGIWNSNTDFSFRTVIRYTASQIRTLLNVKIYLFTVYWLKNSFKGLMQETFWIQIHKPTMDAVKSRHKNNQHYTVWMCIYSLIHSKVKWHSAILKVKSLRLHRIGDKYGTYLLGNYNHLVLDYKICQEDGSLKYIFIFILIGTLKSSYDNYYL